MPHMYETIRDNFKQTPETEVITGFSAVPASMMKTSEKKIENLVERANKEDNFDIKTEVEGLFC